MDDQNGAINWLLSQKRIQASASVRNGNATVNHEEIVGFIDQAVAALTPRHEAPAETITSAELIANTDYARGAVRVPGETEDRRIYGQPEAPAEGAGDERFYRRVAEIVRELGPSMSPGAMAATCDRLADKAALRARSSAPEACEGEAVAWAIFWRHAMTLHVTLEDAKTARKGVPHDIVPLYTHPAAPSADKLRIATDAFDAITDLGRALRSGGPDSSDLNDLSDNLDSAVNIASEALAALKAEGA